MKKPIFFATVFFAASFAPWASSGALAGEADVFLRPISASGEPGQEAAIEFHADLSKAIEAFVIQFELDEGAATFIRTDVRSSASSHAPLRGIIQDPSFPNGGYLTGVRFNITPNEEIGNIAPGKDLLLLRAVFRVRPDAVAGDYPVNVVNAGFLGTLASSLKVSTEDGAYFRVMPPSGPRPVGSLAATQEGAEVIVSWTLTETYDAILVRQGSDPALRLGGGETSFRDRPDPGPISYKVTAIRGAAESLPASVSLLVQEQRPPAVSGLVCSLADGAVALRWRNEILYDSIEVLRNGRKISELEGSAESFRDPFDSDLFTIYTVKARAEGDDALPASCTLNESSDVYVQWAEEVRAEPGARSVPIRVFATNPRQAQALSIGLHLDPALARIRKLTFDGTFSEAVGISYFAYQVDRLKEGETGAGLIFKTFASDSYLPPGVDQHVLTVLVDILPDAPRGTLVPLELGTFGWPPIDSSFTVEGQPLEAEVRSGAILIGESPVPEVVGASAEIGSGTLSPGGGGEAADGARGILLRWTNPVPYTSLRLTRDGKALAEIPGDSTSFLDRAPGPGVHRYLIVGMQGDREGFPVVVLALPSGVPGTFLRGDVNSDGIFNITDIIVLLSFLFLSEGRLACLDAADADDSGSIDLFDPISILYFILLGDRELPPPGTRVPWFDPTADDLPCG